MRYNFLDYMPFTAELSLFSLSSAALGFNISNLFKNFDDTSWQTNRDMLVTGAQVMATAHFASLLIDRYFKNYPPELSKEAKERIAAKADVCDRLVNTVNHAMDKFDMLHQHNANKIQGLETKIREDKVEESQAARPKYSA